MEENITLDTKIKDIMFGFTVRTENCLESENIKTIRDILQKGGKSLLKIPNFGKKSLREVQEFLSANGWILSCDGESFEPVESEQPKNEFVTISDECINRISDLVCARMEKQIMRIINGTLDLQCKYRDADDLNKVKTRIVDALITKYMNNSSGLGGAIFNNDMEKLRAALMMAKGI
jgi:hypothetical protein